MNHECREDIEQGYVHPEVHRIFEEVKSYSLRVASPFSSCLSANTAQLTREVHGERD